jgi:CheY-like chemotaxis protein
MRRNAMLQSNALIVDTSISMRNYVRTILHQELGFNEVHEARDAEDAFQVLKSGRAIHWIFSSMEMPGLSPFELIEVARNSPNSKHTRFVLMSSSEESVIREIAIKKGAADYLCKPFTPSHLVNMVHRLTGLTERRNTERCRLAHACEIDIGFDPFHHYSAELADISLTGCRIKTSRIKPDSGHIDDLTTVMLRSANDAPFQIHAKIKRAEFNQTCTDPLRNTEIAVEFIDITPQLKAKLASFIDKCKEIQDTM